MGIKMARQKFCGKFLRNYKGEKKTCKIHCGISKYIKGKNIKEFCEVCGAYNEGYDKGRASKIKTIKKCQLLTCNKVASRVICEGQYIIAVCPCHSKGHEWRDIKKGEVK